MLALRTAVRKVNRLAYSPDGTRLAVGGAGAEVIDVACGETVVLLGWVNSRLITFRQDNNSLLIDFSGLFVTIVSLTNPTNPFGELLDIPRGTRASCMRALLPGTDEWFVAESSRVTRRKFDETPNARFNSYGAVWESVAVNGDGVHAACLTPFGHPLRLAILASTYAQANVQNKYLYLLDGDTGELIRRHRCGYTSVDHFTGSPCGGYLVGVRQATLVVWDTAALHRPPQRWANDSRKQFTGVAFHPHGRYLLTASNDKSVKLWDLTCGQVVRSYDWSAGRMRSVAVAPDGLTAAAGSDENLVVMFDLDL